MSFPAKMKVTSRKNKNVKLKKHAQVCGTCGKQYIETPEINLVELPEELLIIIVRLLDLNSIRNLFDAGNKYLQEVICSQGAVKEAHLSLCSMATAKSFKLDIFKAISGSLRVLNLSGVKDLTKSTLLPAMEKMSSLVTLDVGYTNIIIADLLEVYKICPTIRNITVCYMFHIPSPKVQHFSKGVVRECQDMFANFKNVHFIGSADNLLHSNLPLHVLQKAKLDALTYTIAQDTMFTCYKNIEKKPLVCNKFTLNICYWKDPYVSKLYQPLPDTVKELPFEYEYVHIHDCSIYISPALQEFFNKNYRQNIVNVRNHIASSLMSNTNHNILIWNKDTTIFDDSFYRELDSEIKKLLPCFVTYSEGMDPVELNNDWVCVIHPVPENNQRKANFCGSKRRRVTPPQLIIDYDEILEDKEKIELTICIYDHIHRPVTLTRTSNYLKKLTFLQIRGTINYSPEFFHILFRYCENLTTLDVEGHHLSPCTTPIAKSIPLSRSIKNLRVVDKAIDLNNLLSSLSQVSNIENIMIIDSCKMSKDIPNADALFKQCDKLYYICICGLMSDADMTNLLTLLNKVKDKYRRHHLYIEVYSHIHPEYSYDPYVDVFRLVVKEDYSVQ